MIRPHTKNRSTIRGSLWVCLPSVATVLLFVALIVFVAVPLARHSIANSKREMLRSLTQTARNILSYYNEHYERGELSLEEAQACAKAHFDSIRYGRAGHGYFWIGDLEGCVVTHPFRTDLIGQNLSDWRSPDGSHPMLDFVNMARMRGGGFVDHMWQRQDDPHRVEPKVSYVQLFEPWGWFVTTGVYLGDVQAETAAYSRRLLAWSSGILGLVLLLSLIVAERSVRTEQRRALADQQRMESERRHRLFYEASHDGIVSCDMSGHFLDCNQAFEGMVGYTREELRNMRFSQLTPSKWHAQDERFIEEKILRDGYSERYEKEFRHKSGEVFPIELDVYLFRNADGEPESMWATIRDITKRREAENAIRNSEQRLRAILDSISAGVVVADGYTRTIIDVNEAAVTLTGQERKQLIGRRACTVLCVSTPEPCPMVDHSHKRVTSSGTILRPNGDEIQIQKTVSRVMLEGAEVLLESFVDVSDRRRAEAELNERVAELSEAKRRLEVVVANIAGREKRMVELKAEVNDLLQAAGLPPKYEAPGRAGELAQLGAMQSRGQGES